MVYRPSKNDMMSQEIDRNVDDEVEKRKNRSVLTFKIQPKIDGMVIREDMKNEYQRIISGPEHLFRMVRSMDPLLGKCAILNMDCEYLDNGTYVRGDCRTCIFAQSYVMKNPEKIFDPIKELE